MDIRVRHASHAYGGLAVLSDIDLVAPAGKILCLVGPSGCGKSTLLRLMGGLERPTSGAIELVGAPPSGCLNELTFVFQHFALLPWASVEGNVRFVLDHHRLSEAERAEIVADVLARTGLADFAEAWPRQLSGGMRQRVAIARALAVRPAVLLMDEPLSALDSQTREILMEDLVGLWTRAPFTAVYVTHNLAEAVRLGHAVAVMSRRPGRIREIVAIDTPLSERRPDDPELERVQARLWSLLRDEAIDADRELVDG
ncbi:ABC transporter ATP-binding protein [Salinarimonas ramus]|uniref:ABC transporter ATP-binding protein n=1 Tax=Salinarimonas ramus TaxID=690164 RepID=A0A917V303_9HYPH|nr:ABC transporter ATP-binding protein [Salinarimonas ramus]GGK27035.1 ABC transporter ATP-binding protein [Salinarimonas ramus]